MSDLPEAPGGGHFEVVDEVDAAGMWVEVVKWRPGSVTENDLADAYGQSPAMGALDDMKALLKLPPEERARAAARFVEWRLGYTDD